MPPSQWVENARAEVAKANFDQKVTLQAAVKNASLSDLLDVLVRAVIEERNGEARAAFYMAEEGKLHHVTGMPNAYAKCVDGFVISPESLACGLAASTGQAIITRDVIEEPLWQPWLWLAKRFDYRGCWSFPVKTSSGNIVGTFAMYFKEPREATDRDLDFAATIARTAAIAMSRPHMIEAFNVRYWHLADIGCARCMSAFYPKRIYSPDPARWNVKQFGGLFFIQGASHDHVVQT